jgi:hypothetical protein
MRRVLKVSILGVTVVAGAMLICTEALADDSTTHSRNSRRQIADCIIKRMSANRMVSFNEATRACKDLAKAQDDNELASNTPPKPISGR